MKAFIMKLCLLSSLVAAVIACIWLSPGVYTTEYAVAINKLDLLKKSMPPRIIIIGGSNVLSIKGDMIEKALPLRVVNLGMWYGINYKYYLDEIKPYLKPGDIVVFIIEYHAYSANNNNSINHESEQIIFMASPMKWLYRYAVEGRLGDGIKAFVEVTQQRTKTALQNIRSGYWSKLGQSGLQDYYKAYNERGELRLQWPVKRPLRIPVIKFKDISRNNWSFLNDFYVYCERNKVRTFISFSPWHDQSYYQQRNDILSIYNWLKEDIKLQILGKPVDFIYPEQLFLDASAHINPAGEKMRTAKLIVLLKQTLYRK